jgi:protein-L-isoaspartate(D-aspartate) O-methyltransferase
MLDASTQRAAMIVSQLRTNDVKDPRVLAAMGRVPREQFVPADQITTAYMEACITLEHGRAIIDPRTLGKLLQFADIAETESVLDVGCATGYSTGVLAQLAAKVVGLESDAELCAAAAKTLAALNVTNARIVQGPLAQGYAGEAPYDVIVLEGAIEVHPEALLSQLKDGGRLLAVVRNGAAAHARLYLNHGGALSERNIFDSQLPMLPGFAKAKQFIF